MARAREVQGWQRGLAVVACAWLLACSGTGSGDLPDTDGEISDTDTVRPDTDPGIPDTDGPLGARPDEGLSPAARCAWGEIRDCNGRCYPEWYVGDGTCDDGSVFVADFNCVEALNDGGDCGVAPPAPEATCRWAVAVSTGNAPNEMGWRVEDQQGQRLLEVSSGNYQEPYRRYEHVLELPVGTYDVVLTDSFGDGWGALTSWQLIEPTTGHELYTDNLGFGILKRRSVRMDCEDPAIRPPTCPVAVTLHPGVVDSGALGVVWRAASGHTVATALPGTLPQGVATGTGALLDGELGELLFIDTTGAGWPAGARAEVRSPGGRLLDVFAMTGGGTTASRYVDVDCDATATDPAPVPLVLDCDTASLRISAGSRAPRVSVTLWEASTWAPVVDIAEGGLVNDEVVTRPLSLFAGDHLLVAHVRNGGGWPGGLVELLDGDGAVAWSASLADGASLTWPVSVTCRATAPPSACAPDAVQDCNGVCFPTAYVGDGSCDDGVQSTANFRCAAYADDGGDCAP